MSSITLAATAACSLNQNHLETVMKYKCMAATLFTALPLLAAAQSSLTIYGVMDAAISSEDLDAPGQGRHTVINSGNQQNSRIGFRGIEDVGYGLKALFNIEAGVSIDTGAADPAGLFQRRAVVGLQHDIGTLTIGREYGPISNVAAASDILGQGFYGSNLSAFVNPNPGVPRLTRRLSNSVNVKSAPLSGFTISAAYSAAPNGTEPVTGSNNLKGAAVEYANGPFYVGVGFQTLKRLPTGEDKEYVLGAGFKFGDFDFKGNALIADQEGPNNRFQEYNLGASWTFRQNKVFVNGKHNKQNGSQANAFTVAYSYALSKRTNAYASYAKLYNSNLGTFGLNSAGTNLTPPLTAPGADPSALTFGVRHTF
jgi:predicted porin